jgi:hypothetical protein
MIMTDVVFNVASLCSVPLAIGAGLDACEVLAHRHQLAPGGFYDFRVLRTGRTVLWRGTASRLLAPVFGYPGALVLPGLQVVASVALLVLALRAEEAWSWAAGVATAVIFVSRSLFYLRQQIGLDGSDQMLGVVSLGLTGAFLLPDVQARQVALGYLAGQLVLAYTAAGVAKLVSPVWRSGRALPRILATVGYGSPRVAQVLERSPLVARALCVYVIAFETLTPLLMASGSGGAWAVVLMGGTFHLGVALLMGLNVFPWAFGATFPAVLLLGTWVDGWWAGWP